MIDAQVYANQMGLLADRVGRPLHAATLGEYYRHLNAALTTQQFVAATALVFRTWSAEFRNWPSPQQIIELIAPTATPALSGAEMFEKVLAATNDPRITPHEARIAVQSLGATALRGFLAAGGMRDFAGVLETDIVWLRKRFVEAYEDACEHADEERRATLALEDADERFQKLTASVANALPAMPATRIASPTSPRSREPV